MIGVYVPTTNGTEFVLGFCAEDLALIVGGSEPPVVDFREVFKLGKPLPCRQVIIYEPTQEMLLARVQEFMPEIEMVPMPPDEA